VDESVDEPSHEPSHEPMDDLIARMVALQAALEADEDPARYFLGTYLRTTQAVRAALAEDLFEDPAWMARWDVDFAGLYLDALEAHRRDPAAAPAPWREAFGARSSLEPQGHVLLGVNAHINFDMPQSLVRVIPEIEFSDPVALAGRKRDNERIDRVLSSRVSAEDAELQHVGDPRTWLDRRMAPLNHAASQRFLREARRKVWANAAVLHRARLAGDPEYRRRLAELEVLSAGRIADLVRPGPVLLRLAVRGFGVTLDPG
jgi:Family of unknown function (DUF5995)